MWRIGKRWRIMVGRCSPCSHFVAIAIMHGRLLLLRRMCRLLVVSSRLRATGVVFQTRNGVGRRGRFVSVMTCRLTSSRRWYLTMRSPTVNGTSVVVVASVRVMIIGVRLVSRKMRREWCLLSTTTT